MTFVLHRAERADILAQVLASILLEPLADPFAAEVVAVHSKGVERWLAHQLAGHLGTSPGRADGVCANLTFPFPGRLVGEALAAAVGVDGAGDPWQPERLAWPLLGVVEANLDEPWLHVLAGHLRDAPGAPDDRSVRPADPSKANRRLGVVRHLAELFDRYAIHRPAMVGAWADGRDEDGEARPLPADAAWQAELWRRVRDAVGTPSPAERLVEGCARLLDDPGLVDLPPRITLFGLTRLPASYVDVLLALAAHRDVNVLALHPSHAAWARLSAHPETAGAPATGHPLVRSWGRDSREMQLVLDRRLAHAPGAEVRAHPLPAIAPTTLLQRLQAAIRGDEAPPAAADRPVLATGDRSVQVHACHGRARQAEVVREAITHLLAADATLEPRDVIVLCPDIDDMAPLLHAAFDDGVPGLTSGAPPLPYRLADRSLRQTNPVLGALSELLTLVEARLTVSQVLAFAALAPVRQRFRLDDDALERVAGWVDTTGTRWGLDGAHREPFGLGEVATGTWDAGLTRLLLGVTMTEDDQRLVGGVLPLDDVDSSDIELAGRFAELVARLGDTVRALCDPRPIDAWADAVNHAADLLFATRSGDAWQRGQLDRVVTEVLAEAGDGSPVPVRLAEVRDLLADRLRGQPSRAAFRTGDITMCTLVPMRSVPHRVVCLVGLDDGAFPRGGSRDEDDLLARARHEGDHDRRSEDRQLLLDAVLSATDALVITYDGRDVRTNEERPPAVPVNELLDVLDTTVRLAAEPAGAGSAPARSLLVHQHPLQPSDRRCFEAGRLGAPGPWSFDPHQLAGARAVRNRRPAHPPFLTEVLPPAPPEATIALESLAAFVQHPVRAFLRQRLGISLFADDDRPLDGLTVEMDALEKWSVGDRLLGGLLAGGDLDAICAAEQARGLLPPGMLGQRTLALARVKAAAIGAEARRVAPGPRRSLEVEVVLPDGRRLLGTVPDVVGDLIRPTTYSRLQPKQKLGAWVRFLAATASHPDRPIRSVLVGAGRDEPETFPFGPLAADRDARQAAATALLGQLADLRDRGLRDPLPLACRTSAAYAEARRRGRGDPQLIAAKEWTSTYGWDREDRDAEHVAVFGAEIPFAALLEHPPAGDEGGAGWAVDEPSRFGRLARRLWDPILDAAAAAR